MDQLEVENNNEKSTSSPKEASKLKDKATPYLNDMIQCLVCGGKASGMHYGVYSCEGCKGFFRRTQRLSLQYKPCPAYPCNITTKSRNKCQYCRYEKCLKLGMSTEAVRMGRVPNAEKDKMLQEIIEANLCSPDTEEEVEEEDIDHKEFVDRITKCYTECYIETTEEEIEGFRTYCSSDFEFGLPFPGMRMTHDGTPSFSSSQLEGPPKKLDKHAHVIRHFACTMEMAIHKSAKFIKKVDEFNDIDLKDRVSLFKPASYDIGMTFMANRVSDGMVHFPEDNTFASQNPLIFIKFLQNTDLQHAKQRFFKRYNDLKLTITEKALLTMLIIADPDREDLIDRNKVELLQEKVCTALEREVRKSHSDASKVFPNTLSLLVVLRELMSSHIKKLHRMSTHLDGKLPMEPSPLIKEVFDLD